MSNKSQELGIYYGTDEMLTEVWRIKDKISTSYRGDLNRLFADLRERQKVSGHCGVSFPKENNETKSP